MCFWMALSAIEYYINSPKRELIGMEFPSQEEYKLLNLSGKENTSQTIYFYK